MRAKPLIVALIVLVVVVGVHAAAPPRDPVAAQVSSRPAPRFMLTAGIQGQAGRSEQEPWFQVYDIRNGQHRQVASVSPPSPSAGVVREIVAAPEGKIVLTASRDKPCRTTLYHVTLTDSGHPGGISPIPGGDVPALAGGIALSPDGRRIAYATTPCDDLTRTAPTAPVTLTVLDTVTGQHRTWTAGNTWIIGNIVWARDGRTLGYSLSKVRDTIVSDTQVHALDTVARGEDLLAGRVLFRQPDDSGSVAGAVMDLDGKSGYGVLHKGRPQTTILFSFSEGEPMRVTHTIEPEPNTLSSAAFYGFGGEPRYACITGPDAFGRVAEGRLERSRDHSGRCSAAYDSPF